MSTSSLKKDPPGLTVGSAGAVEYPMVVLNRAELVQTEGARDRADRPGAVRGNCSTNQLLVTNSDGMAENGGKVRLLWMDGGYREGAFAQ